MWWFASDSAIMGSEKGDPFRGGITISESLEAHWRAIPFAGDSAAMFQALFSGSETAFWLDGVHVGSRWSFMGDASGQFGATVSYEVNLGRLTLQEGTETVTFAESIFSYLERNRDGRPARVPPIPFAGGYVGWFGYELHGECSPPIPTYSSNVPDAFFIRPCRFLAIDHLEERLYVITLAPIGRLNEVAGWVNATIARLESLTPLPDPTLGNGVYPVIFRLNHDRAAHLDEIRLALQWIGEGQTYQVCLTNELSCEVSLDPFDLYRTLRRINPAPFAAYLRWPGGTVICASPERFLSVDADGLVETKPIKGTIRRDPSSEIDRALANTLVTSEKDRAENLMIVDLLRNDLSRVCEVGSVVVPSLMAIESFATVHQLVSTVQGRLRLECSAIDLVKAAFPGGSMTGAPKIHTLGLIDRLERRARGIYSGSLGWIGSDGAIDLNIVIRTIVAQGERLSIGVGGGIVADSSPEAEFEETLLKARALINAIVLMVNGEMMDEDGYRIEGI
jgi:para-aminobenzoate synthetase